MVGGGLEHLKIIRHNDRFVSSKRLVLLVRVGVFVIPHWTGQYL